MGTIFLGAFSACTFSTGSTEATDFSRADAFLREGNQEAANRELRQLSSSGSTSQRAKANFMLCESKSVPEQGDCYGQLSKTLTDATHNAEVADIYALSQYRFFMQQPLGKRLTGLMKLSLQCAGTPAGLKALNYLKGHWGGLNPELRLEAWSAWGVEVHDAQVVKCRAEADPSQVVAIVGLERAAAYQDLEKFKDAALVLEKVWLQVEKSVWWDDVAIVWANLLFKDSQTMKALEILSIFLERRESSFFIGSYESVHFDEAIMMRGQIYESMDKPLKARDEYLFLISSAPNSRLRDDAAYKAALLLPREKRFQALTRFVQDYPESRWLNAAQEALNP